MQFTVRCKGNTEFYGITEKVEEAVRTSGIRDGIAVVFAHHTTVSVLIADDEAGLRNDFRKAVERLVPEKLSYEHNSPGDANAYAHIRSMLCGCSLTVPVKDGKLELGTWQRIFLVDFDNRPRERTVSVTVVESAH